MFVGVVRPREVALLLPWLLPTTVSASLPPMRKSCDDEEASSIPLAARRVLRGDDEVEEPGEIVDDDVDGPSDMMERLEDRGRSDPAEETARGPPGGVLRPIGKRLAAID